MNKPPVPTDPDAPFPRIEIEEGPGSDFELVLRLGLFAADAWTLGNDGPYKNFMTPADVTSYQIRTALLHLLELGIIDIDTDRLEEINFFPNGREGK